MSEESNEVGDGSRKRKGPVTEVEESKKKLKKSFEGYTQELKVIAFANSHALEIKALTDKVQTKFGGKLLTQKLPRHMRRRAMSHNIKRLPRQLQPYAKGVYANQEGLNRKKPSRYHRRRPKNLLQEYQRRNRKHIWLETHIWHAKRFHMVDKWGFKLPWKPTDKSHRAAYRATKSHCLLQDMSYMCCIELSGDSSRLIDRLSHVTSSETGQTFASKACLNGTREGFTVLYEIDKYPHKAIGPVTFMWKPICTVNQQSESADALKMDSASALRTMWVWCHPCIFDDVWKEISRCLELTDQKGGIEDHIVDDKTAEKDAVNGKSDETRGSSGMPYITARYKTDTVALHKDKTMTMKSLTGSILRYRLTGPQANVILADTLKLANIIPVNKEESSADPWWKSYYAREAMALCYGAQGEFMDNLVDCQSSAELSPHCIIATTVQDPRLGRPPKRMKKEGDEDRISTDTDFCNRKVTPDLATSPLWDEKIRNEVKQTKQPDYKIAELKSTLLIPGTTLELGDAESKIPVLMIQRPGVTGEGPTGHNPCPGHGSGWDLLLPKSWGMPFWLAFVFRGARCGGLLEQECSVYEERSLLFPHNYPDTYAGLKHQSDVEDSFLVKYNRTPPSKRPNFTKLGIQFPYNSPWDLLSKYWNSEGVTTNEHEIVMKNGGLNEVVKSSEIISNSEKPGMQCIGSEDKAGSDTQGHEQEIELQNAFKNRNYFVLRNIRVLRQLHLESIGKQVKQKFGRCVRTESVFDLLEKSYPQSLIPVRLEMMCRGVVEMFATVCIPSPDDIAAVCKDRHYGGPLEPKHIDPILIQKKKLKLEMKETTIKKKVKVDRTLKKMINSRDVSLGTCSRGIIGFVCNGGYSLGTGTGGGVGFVTAQGLLNLVRKGTAATHKWTVLVRNSTSLQYRFARICVIA